MSNEIISIDNLTKDYGDNRGIFGTTLTVQKGEIYGLVGINGAGKTTTIRHLMGFLKPQKGTTTIKNMDSWKTSAKLKKYIGYIPGEIAFPDVKTGTDFFKLQAEYLNIKDISHIYAIADHLHLDHKAKLKTMSKGMKQKTAIVSAFMTDAEIYIFDEPTTGLDPLMQKRFSDLIMEQKKRGKTVFMSSHMFDELERTCDHVAFLKDGRIIDVVDMNSIRGNETTKKFKIEFTSHEDYLQFASSPYTIIARKDEYNQATLEIHDKNISELLVTLSTMNVRYITQIPYTLESYFKDKYINAKEQKHD